MNQQDHDRRSLALHRLVIDRLRADPAALPRARETLARWRATSARADHATERWARLLDAGDVDAIVRAALDPSPDGDQLRQSSPLAIDRAGRLTDPATAARVRAAIVRDYGVPPGGDAAG